MVGKENIAIIVVTYNPDILEFNKNLNSYINQVGKVYIVDNSDDKTLKEKLNSYLLSLSKDKIRLISLDKNYGIGKAQNIGVNKAIADGYEYFIEMDQDSILPENYVQSMLKVFKELQRTKKIGGIGPVAINKLTGETYHKRKIKEGVYEVDKTLSSGFFFSKNAWLDVGEKLECLFIDLVDWEWCWRARAKGYSIYVNSDLYIHHLLGYGHKNFLFFKLGVSSPIRNYYQYRNYVILLLKKYIPLKWKIKYLFIYTIKIFIYMLFYDNKILRLKKIVSGINDGIKNILKGAC